jgi:hypothetical protein
MFKRYRWYRIQLPRNSIPLPDAIAQNSLRPDTNFGFTLVDKDGGSSTFRFLSRTKILVAKYDEDGTLAYEDVTTVSFTDFTIIEVEQNLFLRIENPARSLKDLFNTLEGIYGLGFTDRRIDFEKAKPSTIFNSVTSAKLTKLKVTGAVFDDGIIGKMELESKQGIHESQLQMLQRIPYKIDSASYEFLFEGVRGHLTLTANGSVKVGGSLAPRILHLIEMDILSYV